MATESESSTQTNELVFYMSTDGSSIDVSTSKKYYYVVMSGNNVTGHIEIVQNNINTIIGNGLYKPIIGVYDASTDTFTRSGKQKNVQFENPTYYDIKSLLVSTDSANAACVEKIVQTYEVTYRVGLQYNAVITGEGTYNSGDKCTMHLVSYNDSNYTFLGWLPDGAKSPINENPYIFDVTDDVAFSLIFEEKVTPPVKKYSVEVTSTTPNGAVTGSGTFNEGDNVTITATPRLGYKFDRWVENSETLSTLSTFIIQSINSNHNIQGEFSERSIKNIESEKPFNYTINVNYRGNTLKFKWSPTIYSYTFTN